MWRGTSHASLSVLPLGHAAGLTRRRPWGAGAAGLGLQVSVNQPLSSLGKIHRCQQLAPGQGRASIPLEVSGAQGPALGTGWISAGPQRVSLSHAEVASQGLAVALLRLREQPKALGCEGGTCRPREEGLTPRKLALPQLLAGWDQPLLLGAPTPSPGFLQHLQGLEKTLPRYWTVVYYMHCSRGSEVLPPPRPLAS
ncbi:hypothetical protein KIL84_010855 [Mauremys mutica]|uniref:Uncharacterized protein n=1 Tax=Mauremys mutica TaxID=74926 RepID=A0A9D3XCD2_9SAUR|nr:hypothetical protein KIL84_010855 [Mauremys mutica]